MPIINELINNIYMLRLDHNFVQSLPAAARKHISFTFVPCIFQYQRKYTAEQKKSAIQECAVK